MSDTGYVDQGLFPAKGIESGIFTACRSGEQLGIFIYISFNYQVTVLRDLQRLAQAGDLDHGFFSQIASQ